MCETSKDQVDQCMGWDAESGWPESSLQERWKQGGGHAGGKAEGTRLRGLPSLGRADRVRRGRHGGLQRGGWRCCGGGRAGGARLRDLEARQSAQAACRLRVHVVAVQLEGGRHPLPTRRSHARPVEAAQPTLTPADSEAASLPDGGFEQRSLDCPTLRTAAC